jgi:predicted  nucleic acid-binding Zn-ribbon protein
MAWYCTECGTIWSDNAYASIPGFMCYYCGNQLGSEWQVEMSKMLSGSQPKDVMAIVQQVLRQSYKENIEDLQDHADKVKYYNDTKKSIRNEIENKRTYSTRFHTKARFTSPLKPKGI